MSEVMKKAILIPLRKKVPDCRADHLEKIQRFKAQGLLTDAEYNTCLNELDEVFAEPEAADAE